MVRTQLPLLSFPQAHETTVSLISGSAANIQISQRNRFVSKKMDINLVMGHRSFHQKQVEVISLVRMC
jgi:hypothetical protein